MLPFFLTRIDIEKPSYSKWLENEVLSTTPSLRYHRGVPTGEGEGQLLEDRGRAIAASAGTTGRHPRCVS
jgi:hypothetical protein